jgi:hypothetical protein
MVVCICSRCSCLFEFRDGLRQPGKTVSTSTRSEHERRDARENLATTTRSRQGTPPEPMEEETEPTLHFPSIADFEKGEH